MGVIEVEHPVGVVVAFGGQTAIALTEFLDQQGIPILGTSADAHRHGRGPGALRRPVGGLGHPPPQGHERHHPGRGAECLGSLGLPGFAPPLLRHRRPEHGHRPSAGGRGEIYGRHPLRRHQKRRSGGQVHAWHRAGGGCDLRRHRRADARHHGAYRAGRRPQRRLHRRLSPVQPHRQDDACGGGVLGKAGPGSGHQGAGEHPVLGLPGRALCH